MIPAYHMTHILTAPESDDPRLILCDWLEEQDGPGMRERSEFIRVQCKLARMNSESDQRCLERCWYLGRSKPCEKCWLERPELRRRERELLDYSLGLWCAWKGCPVAAHVADGETGSGAIKYVYSRGFVSSITLSWADWLKYHERLFWSLRQTERCDVMACNGTGWNSELRSRCDNCSGSGRVPRPFPTTVDVACEACRGKGCEFPKHHEMMPVSEISPCRCCRTCRGTGRITTSVNPQPLESVHLTTGPDFDWFMRMRFKHNLPPMSGNGTDSTRLDFLMALAAEWPGLRFTLPDAAGWVTDAAQRLAVPPRLIGEPRP